MFLRKGTFFLFFCTCSLFFEYPLYAGNSCFRGESSDEESHRSSLSKPTPKEIEIFNHLNTLRNSPLTTNEEYDQAQQDLKSPLVAEMSLQTYLQLKNPKGSEEANSSIFIGYLENGMKVLTKRPRFQDEDKESFLLELRELLPEHSAPRLARAFFDDPTLPPSQLFLKSLKDFELRQYYIDGALDGEDKRLDKLWKRFKANPEDFGRSNAFIYYLTLFNRLIGALKWNDTNYLIVPATTSYEINSFYSIDYDKTFYVMILKRDPRKLITELFIEEESENLADMPEKTLKSGLKKYANAANHCKLWKLVDTYEDTVKQATMVDPEFYTPEFFEKMKAWQIALLNHYKIPKED